MQLTVNFVNQTYRTRTLAIFAACANPTMVSVVLASSRLRDGQNGNIFLELDTYTASMGTLHESDCGKYCTMDNPQTTEAEASWTVEDQQGTQVLVPAKDTENSKEKDKSAEVVPAMCVGFTNSSKENACVALGYGNLPTLCVKALKPDTSANIPMPNEYTLALMDDALPGDVVYPELIMQSRNITLETTVAYKVVARQEGEELELFVSKA